MTLSGGNEVWRRFIVMQMPEWLAWLKSIHIPSHIRLMVEVCGYHHTSKSLLFSWRFQR